MTFSVLIKEAKVRQFLFLSSSKNSARKTPCFGSNHTIGGKSFEKRSYWRRSNNASKFTSKFLYVTITPGEILSKSSCVV